MVAQVLFKLVALKYALLFVYIMGVCVSSSPERHTRSDGLPTLDTLSSIRYTTGVILLTS